MGKVYRAGPRGVVITWRDGSTTTYAPRSILVLERQPLKIRGRLFGAIAPNIFSYEAPALIPDR